MWYGLLAVVPFIRLLQRIDIKENRGMFEVDTQEELCINFRVVLRPNEEKNRQCRASS